MKVQPTQKLPADFNLELSNCAYLQQLLFLAARYVYCHLHSHANECTGRGIRVLCIQAVKFYRK